MVLHNILLLAIDDLRPQLHAAYDVRGVHTPNIDRLAEESTVFQHAYCQMAICSPSRNSFMVVTDRISNTNFS